MMVTSDLESPNFTERKGGKRRERTGKNERKKIQSSIKRSFIHCKKSISTSFPDVNEEIRTAPILVLPNSE